MRGVGVSGWLAPNCRSILAVTLTAITKLHPRAASTSAGMLFTNPPSTSAWPFRQIGGESPGKLMLSSTAWTASPRSPNYGLSTHQIDAYGQTGQWQLLQLPVGQVSSEHRIELAAAVFVQQVPIAPAGEPPKKPRELQIGGELVGAVIAIQSGAINGPRHCDYSAGQFAADLKLPWLFRRLPSGGYWYLLYKYRRGQFDPMLRRYLADWKLEQLPLPCLTVSVDLVGGQSVVRDRGDAVHAVLESINLPGLSPPIPERHGQAVDGGLVNNIPADVLAARGCNFVIAVSVTAKIERQFGANQPDTPTPRMKTPSTLQTLLRSLQVQNYNLNAIGVQPAEVTIEPDVTGFDLSEFHACPGTGRDRRTSRAQPDSENQTTAGSSRSRAFSAQPVMNVKDFERDQAKLLAGSKYVAVYSLTTGTA